MTVTLKPGTRLRSATDATEVVIVRGMGAIDLRCGGVPMVPSGTPLAAGVAPVPGFDHGTLLGKRYASADGSLEVICVKPGAGALSVGDELMPLKDAKPLPSSD